MSKKLSIAEDYAKRCLSAEDEPEPFQLMPGHPLASVDRQGRLQTRGHTFAAGDALALADWIYATFSVDSIRKKK